MAELRGLGYTGGYTALTDFIRDWRLGMGANAPSRAFVPLKFALGEAFQLDRSEEGLVIGGVWRKPLVAHLKLRASRAFVLVAYPTQGHERLFDAHTRSFAALGSHYLCEANFCNAASGWEKGVVEKNVQDSRRRIWQEAGSRS